VAIGEIELMSTTILPGAQAFGHAFLAEQHLFHLRRVRHHDDDDVGALRHFGAEVQTVAPPSISASGGFLMSCRYSLWPPPAGGRHRRAHDAQADKSNTFVMMVSFDVG
jgi:hypothetical protein